MYVEGLSGKVELGQGCMQRHQSGIGATIYAVEVGGDNAFW